MINTYIVICFSCIFLGSLVPVIINTDSGNISISDCVRRGGAGFYIFLLAMLLNFIPFCLLVVSIRLRDLWPRVFHQMFGFIAAVALVLVAAFDNNTAAHNPIAMTLFISAYVHAVISCVWIRTQQHYFVAAVTTFVLFGIILSFYTKAWIAAFEFSFVTIFSFYLTTFWTPAEPDDAGKVEKEEKKSLITPLRDDAKQKYIHHIRF